MALTQFSAAAPQPRRQSAAFAASRPTTARETPEVNEDLWRTLESKLAERKPPQDEAGLHRLQGAKGWLGQIVRGFGVGRR